MAYHIIRENNSNQRNRDEKIQYHKKHPPESALKQLLCKFAFKMFKTENSSLLRCNGYRHL